MKVWIHGGEGFPIYKVVKAWDDILEDIDVLDIDMETLYKWKKISDDFENMQQEIVNKLIENNIDYWGDDNVFKTVDLEDEEDKNKFVVIIETGKEEEFNMENANKLIKSKNILSI